MAARPYGNLKTIRFEGELLPCWAQLLDLASTICPLSGETRRWFAAFTNSNGVGDSQTILGHCRALLGQLHAHREAALNTLQSNPDDKEAEQVFAAWVYSLDTMMQQASDRPTCSWLIEGLQESDGPDYGGTISLRRV